MGIRELNTTSVSPSPHLLSEKITPPGLPARYLSRGRLLCAVTESLSCCSATIISGRAGTGKTALAVEFARSTGRATAWYKVDAADGDLSVFFKYLVESIGSRHGTPAPHSDLPVIVMHPSVLHLSCHRIVYLCQITTLSHAELASEFICSQEASPADG